MKQEARQQDAIPLAPNGIAPVGRGSCCHDSCIKPNLKKILHIAFMLFGISLGAQDLHFSQFNETPALVNPALTGVEGPLKVSLINKDQWKSVTNAFKTYGANVEARIALGSGSKNRSAVAKQKVFNGINAGLSFYSDKTGDGSLMNNRINLSVSTFLAINKGHFLSVGLQNSYIQRRVNAGNFIFPDQYNGVIYDPNFKSAESFASQYYWYSDAGAGLMYSYDRDEKSFDIEKLFRAHLGFGLYHILQPKDQFIFSDIKSYYKYVIHGDLVKSLGKTHTSIAPSFLVQMQGPSREILFGALVKHSIKGNSKYTGNNRRSSLGYGAYYRVGDAVIFSSMLELAERYTIILGYDVNISPLKSASSYRGGFEIGLKFTKPRPTLYKK
jgi:type IX secretion system PorP/SprF family membrane protein